MLPVEHWLFHADGTKSQCRSQNELATSPSWDVHMCKQQMISMYSKHASLGAPWVCELDHVVRAST